jgi:riboflavin kinase / FMN adenylyltransferase
VIYVYHSIDEVPDPGEMNVTLTLGFFDGVHVGHQRILDSLGTYFDTGVQATGIVTFDRHPGELIAPEKAPLLLTTLQEKLTILSKFKLTYILVIPFEKNIATMGASQFVEEVLVGRLKATQLIVGYDAHFGRGGEGDTKLLEQMGQTWNFKTKTVEAVKQGSKPVSSTVIRGLIEKGDVRTAEQMLGRRYSITGKVVKGIGVGRKIGVPTINIETDARKLIPQNGIYACWCDTPSGRWKTALNIGLRPTLPLKNPTRTIEAHLIDFDGDLYGSEVTLEFVTFVRPERKFENVKYLVEQIHRDIELAKNVLKN